MQNAQYEKAACLQKRKSKIEYDEGRNFQKFQNSAKKVIRQRRAKTNRGEKDLTAELNKDPNLKNSEF